jgi:hypothetical protein
MIGESHIICVAALIGDEDIALDKPPQNTETRTRRNRNDMTKLSDRRRAAERFEHQEDAATVTTTTPAEEKLDLHAGRIIERHPSQRRGRNDVGCLEGAGVER